MKHIIFLTILCACSPVFFYRVTEHPLMVIDSISHARGFTAPDTSLWVKSVLIGDDSLRYVKRGFFEKRHSLTIIETPDKYEILYMRR